MVSSDLFQVYIDNCHTKVCSGKIFIKSANIYTKQNLVLHIYGHLSVGPEFFSMMAKNTKHSGHSYNHILLCFTSNE